MYSRELGGVGSSALFFCLFSKQIPFEGLTPRNVVTTVRAFNTMQCLSAL